MYNNTKSSEQVSDSQTRPLEESTQPISSPVEEYDDFVIEADPVLVKWVHEKCEEFGITIVDTKSVKSNITKFITHDNIQFLFIGLDQQGKIFSCLKLNNQLQGVKKLVYFIKDPIGKELVPQNIDEIVIYGCVQDGGSTILEQLLDLIKNIFAPELLTKDSLWPESIKKDFTSHLHKFLASLTETTYRMKGSTVLYIPMENIDEDISEARKKKDLVQRLECNLLF